MAKIKKRPQKKTRKDIRKEKRKEKKIRKAEFYSKKKIIPGRFVLNPNRLEENADKSDEVNKPKPKNFEDNKTNKNNSVSVFDKLSQEHKKEKQIKKKLEKEMQKQRKTKLLEANEMEEREIKKLEKNLKLNKKKSKKIPKSFINDGLDYILELCETETMKEAVESERQLIDTSIDDEFENDFTEALNKSKPIKKQIKSTDNDSDDESNSNDINENDFSDIDDTEGDEEEDFSDMDMDEENSIVDNDGNFDEGVNKDDNIINENEENSKKEFWEDIYGRTRDKDGKIVEKPKDVYIPPAVRARMASSNGSVEDDRLKRQMKGLLNRLAESNLHHISNEIEALYSNQSRYSVNSNLTTLVLQALISPVLAPVRQVADYALLLASLHANVDTEIGAYFLQSLIKKFNELFKQKQSVENKELENVINILSELYNLKVIGAVLIHDILKVLLNLEGKGELTEQSVACAIAVLRATGPLLRRADPVALKDTLLKVQNIIVEDNSSQTGTRLKFLLDILVSIKNNNFTKIPNFDPDFSERLRKVLRSVIRKGNSVTQLNISLNDLLQAETCGRWWAVGSAWTGTIDSIPKEDKPTVSQFSQQLLRLAQDQRMNTDSRKNIFCILMSAEDYLDAFEKLLRLGLRSPQDREIMYVLLHCCLREKQFNPYYTLIAQKFCEYDRKYQMALQCSIRDRVRAFDESQEKGRHEVVNLAQLLSDLLINDTIHTGFVLRALNANEITEITRASLRVLRLSLLNVLIHADSNSVERVWLKTKVPQVRTHLRLFIKRFILCETVNAKLNEDKQVLLKKRAAAADKILCGENVIQF